MARLTLAAALEKKKMSKRQFAKRLGAHYHSVFQFFKPTYNPTFKTMTRWAKAIGCRVRDLFQE